ncbi:MAG TPA: magnesium transporter [Plantibacter sp.]|uniref:magnesium transporter n=1 Tax=unclassified Plantibacter TaxID=2624265 RepID=UPI002BFFB3B7|nr:magnesium transporter [Plantibacter sp.]
MKYEDAVYAVRVNIATMNEGSWQIAERHIDRDDLLAALSGHDAADVARLLWALDPGRRFALLVDLPARQREDILPLLDAQQALLTDATGLTEPAAVTLPAMNAAGAVGDLDLRRSGFFRMVSARGLWLALLTVFGIVTSTFVAAQEELLMSAITLAAFVAPIIDMGGNTGSQSATLVVRGMALGQVRLNWRDLWFVVRREIPIAATLGIAIAILEAVLAFFSKGVGGDILLIVGLTMVCVTILGGIIGGLLPFAARRVGADPATLSSPLITSVMDLLGVVIYFGIAYAVLGSSIGG